MCFLFLGVNANVGGSDSYGFEEGESFDDYNEFDSTRRSVVKFKEDDETEDSKEVIFSTNTLSSNFWKKKIKNLGIVKNLLLYHLKPTCWQSMHKWKSFRTSKFTLKLSGLKFF